MTNTNNIAINIDYVLTLPVIDNGNGQYWVADDNDSYLIQIDDDGNPCAIQLCGTMNIVTF